MGDRRAGRASSSTNDKEVWPLAKRRVAKRRDRAADRLIDHIAGERGSQEVNGPRSDENSPALTETSKTTRVIRAAAVAAVASRDRIASEGRGVNVDAAGGDIEAATLSPTSDAARAAVTASWGGPQAAAATASTAAATETAATEATATEATATKTAATETAATETAATKTARVTNEAAGCVTSNEAIGSVAPSTPHMAFAVTALAGIASASLIIRDDASRDRQRTAADVQAAAGTIAAGAPISPRLATAAVGALPPQGTVASDGAVSEGQGAVQGRDTAAARARSGGGLRCVPCDHDLIEREVAAVIEDAAAERVAATKATCVGGLAACNRQIAQHDGDAAQHLESAVDLIRVDDGRPGAGALDRLREAGRGQVEVASHAGALIAPGNAQLVGSGREVDGIVLAVAIGLKDGVAQAADAHAVGEGGRCDGRWGGAVFELLQSTRTTSEMRLAGGMEAPRQRRCESGEAIAGQPHGRSLSVKNCPLGKKSCRANAGTGSRVVPDKVSAS